jgi:hypothetical protein
MITAALAALLLAAPVDLAPLQAPSPLAPTLHLSAGTGICDRAMVPGGGVRSPNPCFLVIGIAATLRYQVLEAGITYEGRQPVDVLTLFAFRPPTATVIGGTLGVVGATDDRWRLSAAGELGWRQYAHFAGHGPTGWRGEAHAPYAGVVGRVATGLRNTAGRTDRFEVTLAWRRDLRSARADVDGQAWRVGGWSLTMGVGLVADW